MQASDYTPNYFNVQNSVNWEPPSKTWVTAALVDNPNFKSRHFRVVNGVLQVQRVTGVFLLSANINFIRTNGAIIRIVIERDDGNEVKEIILDNFSTTAISWSHGNDWTSATSSITNLPIEVKFLDTIRLECMVETNGNGGGCNVRHKEIGVANTTTNFGAVSLVLLHKTGDYQVTNTIKTLTN